MNRGAWRATVHRAAKSRTRLSDLACTRTSQTSNKDFLAATANFRETLLYRGFSGGSDCKESAGNAGDLGSISALGRYPREGNGYPLQYSCLENSMDRGAWWTIVHGIAKSQTRATFSFFITP